MEASREALRYPYRARVQTRWSDNDLFGHLNNAVYYEIFDSVINRYLSEGTGLEPVSFPSLGVVAESSCRFRAPVAFPATLEVGLEVDRLGRSSVTYALGLFVSGQTEAAAEGRWVHVYVDPATRQPVEMPEIVRTCLEPLCLDESEKGR